MNPEYPWCREKMYLLTLLDEKDSVDEKSISLKNWDCVHDQLFAIRMGWA